MVTMDLRRSRPLKRRSPAASAVGLLSSIMASTSFSSTRWSMCVNLATGVPTSGVLRFVPVLDRVVEQFARLLGEPRQHRREVDDELAEQIERDGADVLQLAVRGPGLCAAPTACVLRRTDSPGRPAP